MKKIFRNVMIGFLSVLFIGMMLVSAGVYPTPFIDNNKANVAVVYGAAGADGAAADTLVNSLAGKIVTIEELERIMSAGVSEDEVELGTTPDGKIKSRLTDNKIPSLFDGRIRFHDGDSSNRYNVHEEILINSGLKVETSFDNNDFEGVVLTNNKGLEYRYVFDEGFDDSLLGDEDADLLEVVILGVEYSIEEIDSDSITVTSADQSILQEGTSVIFEGKTLTVDSIYETGVFINAVYIKEGKKKTINGVQVRVETIYYRDSTTLPSKVELSVGGEISKEYSDGDAFIGEDEDDPEWVWSISDITKDNGYIGVRYDLRQVDEEDDVVYEGEEYVFPNNFTIVRFDSLTDVDYYDYDVFFDDVDLYAKDSPGENGVRTDDVEVMIINGDDEDSFELSDDSETDTIYLERTTSDNINVYYMDLAEDFSTGKPVNYTTINSVTTYSGDDCDFDLDTDVDDFGLDNTFINGTLITNGSNNLTFICSVTSETTIPETSIATLIADETEFDVKISMDKFGVSTLTINGIEISIGNTTSFTQLGVESENADNDDVKVNNKPIGTEDNDVMDYYGTIIEKPENNADDDKVVLRIPSEQVYAQISVLGSEEDSNVVVVKPTAAELGITKVVDSQVATVVGKNLIVVGGPCINTLAAELLGGKYCGTDFTTKTGVNAGQVLIQTFQRGGNLVTLVSGYHAVDTTRGVSELLKGNINIAVGEKVII